MSDYLFSKPGWLSGAARTLDLFGVYDDYNESVTPEQADAIALQLDWIAVGNDIAAAGAEFAEEEEQAA